METVLVSYEIKGVRNIGVTIENELDVYAVVDLLDVTGTDLAYFRTSNQVNLGRHIGQM